MYEGYKDVAAMVRALSQRARIVNEVARRLVLKLERKKASGLIEEHVKKIALEEGVIMSFFFPEGLPENHETKYPGLAESFLELRDSVTQLSQLRDAAVNERLNALGFDKDVLFIKTAEPGTTTVYTYDWMISHLLEVGGNPDGPLGTSYEDDKDARTTRINFDLKASTYLQEFDRIEDEYDAQLIAICGPDPDNSFKPNLTDPLSGGGLLDQQSQNVQLALNAIERVTRQMENVRTRVEIEQDRVAQLKIVSDKRINIINATGQKIADLTEQIAGIQGEMAIANGIAQGAASALSGGPLSFGMGAAAGACHVANGFAQADMQRRIGKKQAAIQKLQSEQQAKFEYLNQQGEAINSAAQIKNWFLELRTLEIDMLDAEIRHAQELKRLAQYWNEIENKVMRQNRSLDRLTRRSFADPTYRIEVTNTALKAEDSFQVAQTWVYFLAKALDYKFPTGKFEMNMTFQDILMARTAEKLKSIANAMKTYNMTQQGSVGNANWYYWNYSLRKEYMGMTFDKQNLSGNIRTAVEQFQDYLTERKNNSEYIEYVDNEAYISIPFSTVKFDIADDNAGTASLEDSLGNSHTASATPIFKTGLWDCKIDWVQVNLIGASPYTGQTAEIFLWYGGSGFVRTKNAFTDTTGSKTDFLVFSNPAYDFSYVPGRPGFWLGSSALYKTENDCQTCYRSEGYSGRSIQNRIFQGTSCCIYGLASADSVKRTEDRKHP